MQLLSSSGLLLVAMFKIASSAHVSMPSNTHIVPWEGYSPRGYRCAYPNAAGHSDISPKQIFDFANEHGQSSRVDKQNHGFFEANAGGHITVSFYFLGPSKAAGRSLTTPNFILYEIYSNFPTANVSIVIPELHAAN